MSLPERNTPRLPASGQSTAQTAAALINASPNHNAIDDSVGLTGFAGATRRKAGVALIGRAVRGYITPNGPTATAKHPSKPRHGEAGRRKVAVTSSLSSKVDT